MDRNDAQTSFECILATFSLFCSNLKLPLSYHSTLWPLDGDILKLAQLAFLVTLLLFSDIYWQFSDFELLLTTLSDIFLRFCNF